MKIKTKEQANAMLHRIAEIENSLNAKESAKNDVINKANQSWSEFSLPLREELDAIVGELHEYADKNRASLMPDSQSVTLPNGTLGYRKTPETVEVSEKTADLLIEAGLAALVKIKKEPVKSAIKNLDDEDLKRFEAKRVPGQENFYAKAVEIRQPDSHPAA